MSLRSIWRYARQFFRSKQDRLDAEAVRAYYEQLLQDSVEGEDDLTKGPGFRRQHVYGRIREAISTRPPVKRLQRYTVRLAAFFATAVCVSLGYWYMMNETTPVAPAMKTEHNALLGEVRQLTLPDGSNVWLNSGSTISYFADNGTPERTVELQGEAYFDIVSDRRPLVVHTGILDVQVLGTGFNIRAHPDENEVAVSVMTGSVRVGVRSKDNGRDEITLHHGQQVRYDKVSNRLMQPENVKADGKAAWIAGSMRYEATPLRAILADLERRFHIETDVDSRLAECLVTVDFGNDEPAKALAILAGVLGGDVRYKQGIYKLTGQPCR